MSKVNSLLSMRFKKATDALSKMTSLGEQSSSGHLSSFSGVFKVSDLNDQEKEQLHTLLSRYQEGDESLKEDLFQLCALTAEIKAINTQAILLHGERIKKAQQILKNYKDGAFTAWLIATYGNRQTPYNFLQYFQLHSALQEELRERLEEMPRQAVYSLASREGDLEKKVALIKQYQNEPKEALLKLIRDTFPLNSHDQRAQDSSLIALQLLSRLYAQLSTSPLTPNAKQKTQLLDLLKQLNTLIKNT